MSNIDSRDVMLLIWWLLAIWLVIRGHSGLRRAEQTEECDASIIEPVGRPPGEYSGNDFYLAKILNGNDEGKELIVSQPGYADEIGDRETLIRRDHLAAWELGSRGFLRNGARFTLLWGYGLLAGAAIVTAFFLRAVFSADV